MPVPDDTRPDSTDLDVLVARIRTHAAAMDAGGASSVVFLESFKGLDETLRRDIDVALGYAAPFEAPAAGKWPWLKGQLKRVLRRMWGRQTTFNTASTSVLIGLNDKATAVVLEVQGLRSRIAALEAQLGATEASAQPESAGRDDVA